MRVRKVVFSAGERWAYLEEPECFPAVLPMRWAVTVLRRRKSTSTIEAHMRAVKDLYVWAAGYAVPFDPEARLRAGDTIGEKEVMALSSFVRACGRWNVIPFGERKQSEARNGGVRDNEHFNAVMARIRNFVLWVLKRVEPPLPRSELEAQAARFDAQLLPKRSKRDRKGLSHEDERELRRLSAPDCGANPFHGGVRFRNDLIVRLMLETGLRRGELCKLKVGDFEHRAAASPLVHLRRVPNDSDDPRVNEPRVKTRPRMIPISDALARDLTIYIKRLRGRVKHPFLFVSSRGAGPISIEAVNYVVAQLRRASPKLRDARLTPHLLRYTFTDRIWEAAERTGLSAEDTVTALNYLCGWTELSKQSQQYGRRAIEAQALKLLSEMHQRNLTL